MTRRIRNHTSAPLAATVLCVVVVAAAAAAAAAATNASASTTDASAVPRSGGTFRGTKCRRSSRANEHAVSAPDRIVPTSYRRHISSNRWTLAFLDPITSPQFSSSSATASSLLDVLVSASTTAVSSRIAAKTQRPITTTTTTTTSSSMARRPDGRVAIGGIGTGAGGTRRTRMRLPTRREFRLFDRDYGGGSDDGNVTTEPLPAWVQSLLRWKIQPTLPSLKHMPPPTVEEEKEALEVAKASELDVSNSLVKTRPRTYPDDFPDERRSEGRREGGINLPVPLASLINVEALLLASGGDILDEASDLSPFSGSVVTSGVSDVGFSAREAADEGVRSERSGYVNITAVGGPLNILPNLEELGDFNGLVQTLRSSMGPFFDGAEANNGIEIENAVAATVKASDSRTGSTTKPPPPGAVSAAELVLRSTTSRIASFLDETSTALSAAAVRDLVVRASSALAIEESAGGIRAAADVVVRAAEKLASERGMDVSFAAARARETTKYTEDLLKMANGVLVSGYVRDDGRGVAGKARTPAKRRKWEEAGALEREKAKEGEGVSAIPTSLSSAGAAVANAVFSKPLFSDFSTARAIAPGIERRRSIEKPVEMVRLAGAIYENTVKEAQEAGHSIVAQSKTGDVAWMVTDSIGYEEDFRDGTVRGGLGAAEGASNDANTNSRSGKPIMVRTFTIRGFDASDDEVDRERLLMRITSAAPVPMGGKSTGVRVHAGLLSVARKLYNDIMEYVDNAAPQHRIVLNGHSIGGSLSVLVLLLMCEKRGVDFVNDKVLRVFTFGSPPVAMQIDGVTKANVGSGATISIDGSKFGGTGVKEAFDGDESKSGQTNYFCSILGAFGLPADMVYGFVQPWDPITRLFSSIDPLYPLVEDIGEDGVTLYASGPNRALRPITRAILESWDGWNRFRDNIRESSSPSFVSVGVQHLLLPEPVRYLTDRLVGVNLGIPPVDTVIRISSEELLPSLEQTYPLDVFGISFVPAALRSFVHHFYPAYVEAFVEFAEGSDALRKKNSKTREDKKSSKPSETKVDEMNFTEEKVSRGAEKGFISSKATRKLAVGGGIDSSDDGVLVNRKKIFDWAGASAQWILGGNKIFGGEDEIRR